MARSDPPDAGINGQLQVRLCQRGCRRQSRAMASYQSV